MGYLEDNILYLFRLGGVFSHYRPRDILWKIVYSYAHDYLKKLNGFLKSIITWSEMGQETGHYHFPEPPIIAIPKR